MAVYKALDPSTTPYCFNSSSKYSHTLFCKLGVLTEYVPKEPSLEDNHAVKHKGKLGI